MKVMILTNGLENYRFIMNEAYKYAMVGEDFLVSWNGKYDWTPDFDYDIGISYMYQYKVPAKELSHTWFNFHPGLLPEYKGRNLCYHAIMNGAKSFGATVHYMDEDFDTGCIIETLDFPVEDSWTAQDLHDKTMEASKTLFEKFFPLILTGREFGCTANEGGEYYKKEPIDDFIFMTAWGERHIRAITYGSFYPKIDIGGVVYKIVRDE